MEALLLVNTRIGTKEEVVSKMFSVKGVLNAYPVYGAYEVVAMVDVEDIASFQRRLKLLIPEIELATALLPESKDIDIVHEEQLYQRG